MQAKRGDLAVIEYINSYTTGDFRRVTRNQYDLAEVTSITRDGMVKAVRDQWGQVRPIDQWFGFQRALVVPAADVDKGAVLAAVAAHHYGGHPGQPKPFDSLDEVRALVGPHRVTVSA